MNVSIQTRPPLAAAMFSSPRCLPHVLERSISKSALGFASGSEERRATWWCMSIKARVMWRHPQKVVSHLWSHEAVDEKFAKRAHRVPTLCTPYLMTRFLSFNCQKQFTASHPDSVTSLKTGAHLAALIPVRKWSKARCPDILVPSVSRRYDCVSLYWLYYSSVVLMWSKSK